MISQTPHDHLHFVLGLVADKNVNPVLQLLPSSATYYFCRADIPRAMQTEVLRRLASEHDLTGQEYSSVREAYAAAMDNAKTGDIIFVGGSTFVVAEVL